MSNPWAEQRRSPRCFFCSLILLAALGGIVRAADPAAPTKSDPSSDSAAALGPLALDVQPADAAMMVAVRPHLLLGREGLKIADANINALRTGLTNPVSIRQLEQITFVRLKADPQRPARDGNGTNLIFELNVFRTKSPIDWEQKLQNYPVKLEEQRYGETVFYAISGEPSLRFWPVDERTYVVAEDYDLKRAIDAHRNQEAPPWKETIQQVPAAALAIAADAEYVRGEFEKIAAGLGDQRLIGSLAKSLLEKATAISLIASDREQCRLDAALAFADEKAAKKGTESIKALVALVRSNRKQLLDSQLQRAAGSDAASRERYARLAEKMFESIRIEQQASHAAVGVQLEMKMAAVMPMVIQSVGQFAGMGGVPAEALFAESPDPALRELPAGVLNSPALVERRARSVKPLQRVGIAMHQHHSARGFFPPQAICDEQGTPLLSWRVALLPYLGEEEKALYGEFHLDEPWDSEHNRTLLARMPKVYAGPAPDVVGASSTEAALYAVVGPHTMFPEFGGTKISQVKDGTNNTILLVESMRHVPWTRPEDIPLREDGHPRDPLGGWHALGFHVLMADGSILFLEEKVVRDELPRMLRIDDVAVQTAEEDPAEPATEEAADQ
ncbi:MAG: DUF1559 domain-containing protein [Pirellulales bacterium]|nr:DUF1559 domain-containing protein [Pirellulales bacterium]